MQASVNLSNTVMKLPSWFAGEMISVELVGIN